MKAKRVTGHEIIKHRNEINRVRGDYSVLEEKLFVLVYSKLTGMETELPPITLLTTEVCKALNTRHEDMRRAMKRLTVTPMEVGHIDDLDSDYEVIMPIIRFAHIPKEKTITITLNPALKDYFLAVRQQFTTYIAEHCYRLSSRYSIRIYKLIMQWWSKIEEHEEWEVVLDYQELREYFRFKPEQYKRTFDFRDKILIPAIEDINQAKIGLDLEIAGTQKAGRNITDYVILARKATATTPKRVTAKSSKKELSDEEFIAQNAARFDELLNLELAQPELPGMPTMSKDFRIQACKGKALLKLKAELAKPKKEK